MVLATAHLDAARPRYGGTVRIQETGTIGTLDPSAEPADASERWARAHLLPQVFETLVAVDPAGGLRPLLATAWERDGRGMQWRFRLRPNVMLHDGSLLEPWHVASALRAADRTWTVTIDRDAVVIEPSHPRPDLPWELAEHRYAVAIRSARDWIGSGAFRVDRHEPGRLTLRAHDDYWNGRPFLDAVRIDLGQPPGQQVSSLELGRADLVSVRPTDGRRLAQRGLRTLASRPLELVALVFDPHRAQAADDSIRRAVAVAIDRSVISTALLQRRAEPAAALLPQWVSGYRMPADLRRAARAKIAALPPAQRAVTLRIDPSDPLAQAIAERIVVDARAAGVSLTVQAPTGLAPKPDARLVRVRIPATSPDRALAALMSGLGGRAVALASSENAPPPGAPIETVYMTERALLARDIIVPVVHVSEVYAVGNGVESWNGPLVGPSGAWRLANAWLVSHKPDQR